MKSIISLLISLKHINEWLDEEKRWHLLIYHLLSCSVLSWKYRATKSCQKEAIEGASLNYNDESGGIVKNIRKQVKEDDSRSLAIYWLNEFPDRWLEEKLLCHRDLPNVSSLTVMRVYQSISLQSQVRWFSSQNQANIAKPNESRSATTTSRFIIMILVRILFPVTCGRKSGSIEISCLLLHSWHKNNNPIHSPNLLEVSQSVTKTREKGRASFETFHPSSHRRESS